METIRGRGVSPRLVLIYVQGLPDDSLTHALVRGGREHYGWGQDRHILADIFDAINTNTSATGQWKKPPSIPAWPRPSEASAAQKKPTTVKDLWARFNREAK